MQLFELIKLTFIERKNICSNLPDRSKKIKRNLKQKVIILFPEFCFILVGQDSDGLARCGLGLAPGAVSPERSRDDGGPG